MIDIKTTEEINKIKKLAQIISEILKIIKMNIRPNTDTLKLDEIASKTMKDYKVKPAFLGYKNYPASICVSINNELVHGIPSKDKIIKEGDIVTVDIGIQHGGFYADMAETIPVGNISTERQRLLNVTKNCIDIALKYCSPLNRIGDISYSIQKYVESNGFSVVRDFVGHCIGRNLHEKPEIPNFGKKNYGDKLYPGMVLCLEPMVCAGDWQVEILSDGWTVITKDRKDCAHFENMVLITESVPEVLTNYF